MIILMLKHFLADNFFPRCFRINHIFFLYFNQYCTNKIRIYTNVVTRNFLGDPNKNENERNKSC